MIITTTPSVEGYHISEYIDTVAGAATYLIGGWIGEGFVSSRQSSQLSFAWREAVEFMKKAANNADAIVGIQHTLCAGANGNMVLSVTGTAVKLVEDPVHRMQREQEQLEIQARSEEAARIAAEERQREQELRKQEQELKKQEQEKRDEQLRKAYENNQLIQIPINEEDREKLIEAISYATNLSFISKVRAKLKQTDLETGQEIIELLLSLSDDELKPAAQGILMMLKNRT